MRKLVYTGNILSSIPAALVVPLVPFIFILIDGEGRIPGYLHENLLRFLMVLYPIALIICLLGSIRLLRRDRLKPALWISLTPLMIFGLLVLTYMNGGIVLR